jgi:hypothetical protein
MKTKLFVLAFWIAFVAVGAFAQDRIYRKEFAVDPGARFSLDSYKGKIVIRTGNISVIRVKARIYGSRTSVDNYGIIEHAAQNMVTLEGKYSGRSGYIAGNMPSADWDITLPETIDLVLKTYKSEVDLDVPSGRVLIESYKGTGSIRGVRNSFKLDTYKGGFTIEVSKLADLDIDTYKGDISLVIFEPSDFILSGGGHKGQFNFRGLDIPVEEKGGGNEVFFSKGSARSRIDLQTYKGTYNVDFR